MKDNVLNKTFKKFNRGYTLIELLIVLAIFGTMLALASYGVIKFRQVLIISNASKEVMINLRKARRYAINNVVTSEGYTPQGYYLDINNDDLLWGECIETSTGVTCSDPYSVKSAEFSGVSISGCKNGGNEYNVIKFNHVTGEFVITADDKLAVDPSVSPDSCQIEISISGTLTTQRTVTVSSEERTIKIDI